MVMHLLEVISFPSCLLYMVFSRIKDIFSICIEPQNIMLFTFTGQKN